MKVRIKIPLRRRPGIKEKPCTCGCKDAVTSTAGVPAQDEQLGFVGTEPAESFPWDKMLLIAGGVLAAWLLWRQLSPPARRRRELVRKAKVRYARSLAEARYAT
jgi:hypothetical protein